MPNQQACDPNRITLFLNDQLQSEQHAEFSAHLDECETCQLAMDDAAADQQFWNETVKHLAQTTMSPANHEFDVHDDEDNEIGQVDYSVESLLNALLPTDDPEMLGRIGEYEIGGVVGIGGMGAVLKGFDKSLMRVVAIKVMAPHLANKGSARKRFEREARAAAAISHDNVCDIYRVDELNGLPYLVMPFARGQSLQKRVDEGGPLSTIDIVLVGKQVASGLAAAHEQGLVHRDIKPANILLNDCVERILITDFGVARAMDDASMTQTGLIAGTPQYMSPEQARGEIVDQRSDLFSLGALLYTTCTGRPPFRAEAPFGILRKITDSEQRSILEINPEIPSWLVAIIDRLLEKDPCERFESAAEVASLFEKCLAHLRQPNQIHLPRTVVNLAAKPVKSFPAEPKATGNRLFMWLAVAASLFGIGILGLLRLTDAPDIAGNWQGDWWKGIQLKSVHEAGDWYAGTFVDDTGNQGAIHLEWSRMERRYKGRWSVDANTSGTIVLRSANDGSVRGAIMLDSVASSNSTGDQLRDFQWKPGGSGAIARTARPKPRLLASEATAKRRNPNAASPLQTRSVFSPQEGLVAKIAEGIRPGTRVEQGQHILELAPLGRGKTIVEQSLRSVREQLNSANSKLLSFEKSIENLKLARELAVQKAEEKLNVAEANRQSKAHAIVGMEAETRQARASYERTNELAKNGIKTKDTLDAAKKNYETAKATMEAAELDLKALSHEVKVKRIEVETAKNDAQVAVDRAVQEQKDTAIQIGQLEGLIVELENESRENSRVHVAAPIAGTIAKLSVEPHQIAKRGDLILEISPVAERVTTIEDRNFELASSENSQTFRFSIGSVPEVMRFASELDERIRKAKDSIGKVEKEIAEIVAKADKNKRIVEGYNEKIQKREKPGGQTTSELEILKGHRSAEQNLLDELNNQKKTLEQIQESREEEYRSAINQLSTSIEIMKSELVATREQQKLANDMTVALQRSFEMGETGILEFKQAKLRSSSLESKVRTLEQLIKSFEQLLPQSENRKN